MFAPSFPGSSPCSSLSHTVHDKNRGAVWEQSGNKAHLHCTYREIAETLALHAVHLITAQKLFSHMTSTFNLVKDDLLTLKCCLLKDWRSEFGFNNSSCLCTVHRKCSMGVNLWKLEGYDHHPWTQRWRAYHFKDLCSLHRGSSMPKVRLKHLGRLLVQTER